MSLDELKTYFRRYLSGDYLKCVKTDKGVQINDLKTHVIRQFALIDSIPKKKRFKRIEQGLYW